MEEHVYAYLLEQQANIAATVANELNAALTEAAIEEHRTQERLDEVANEAAKWRLAAEHYTDSWPQPLSLCCSP